jgi:hypothetical protein
MGINGGSVKVQPFSAGTISDVAFVMLLELLVFFNRTRYPVVHSARVSSQRSSVPALKRAVPLSRIEYLIVWNLHKSWTEISRHEDGHTTAMYPYPFTIIFSSC